jgi:hypothetical protein
MASNILTVNVSSYKKANYNVKSSYNANDQLNFNILYENDNEMSDFDLSFISQQDVISQTGLTIVSTGEDQNIEFNVEHNYDTNSFTEEKKIYEDDFITTYTTYFVDNVLQSSNYHRVNSNSGSYSNIFEQNDITIYELGDSESKFIHNEKYQQSQLLSKHSISILDNIQSTNEYIMQDNTFTKTDRNISKFDQYGFVQDIKQAPFDLNEQITTTYDFVSKKEFTRIQSFTNKTIEIYEKNIVASNIDEDGFIYPVSYLSYPNSFDLYEKKSYYDNVEVIITSNLINKSIDIVHKDIESKDIYGFPVLYTNTPLRYLKNILFDNDIEITTETFHKEKRKTITHKHVNTFNDFGFGLTYDDIILKTTSNIENNIQILVHSNLTSKTINVSHKKINQLDEYGFPLSFIALPLVYSKYIDISTVEKITEIFHESKIKIEKINDVKSFTPEGFALETSNISFRKFEILNNIQRETSSNFEINTFMTIDRYIENLDPYGLVITYKYPELKQIIKNEYHSHIHVHKTTDFDNKVKETIHRNIEDQLVFHQFTAVNGNIEHFRESNIYPHKTVLKYHEKTILNHDIYGFSLDFAKTNVEFIFEYSNSEGNMNLINFHQLENITEYYIYPNPNIQIEEFFDMSYMKQKQVKQTTNNELYDSIYTVHEDYTTLQVKQNTIINRDMYGFALMLRMPLNYLKEISVYPEKEYIFDNESIVLYNIEIAEECNHTINSSTVFYRKLKQSVFSGNQFINTYVDHPNDLIYEQHISINHQLNEEVSIEKDYIRNQILEVTQLYSMLDDDINSLRYGFVKQYNSSPNRKFVKKQINHDLLQESVIESNYNTLSVLISENKIKELDDYGFILTYDEVNKLIKKAHKYIDVELNNEIYIESNLYAKTLYEEHKPITEFDSYGFSKYTGSKVYDKTIIIEDTNEHSVENIINGTSNITITKDKEILEYNEFGFARLYSPKQHVMKQTTSTITDFNEEEIFTFDRNNVNVYYYQFITNNNKKTFTIERTYNPIADIQNVYKKNFDDTSVVSETIGNKQTITNLDQYGRVKNKLDNTISDNLITTYQRIEDYDLYEVYDTTTTPSELLSKLTIHLTESELIENSYDSENILISTRKISPPNMIFPYDEHIIYNNNVESLNELKIHYASVNEKVSEHINIEGNVFKKIETVIRESDGKTQDTTYIYDLLHSEWKVIDSQQSMWYYSDKIDVFQYDNGSLKYSKEVDGVITTERYYDIDLVKLTYQNTNYFPYSKRTIYGDSIMSNNVKVLYENFLSENSKTTKYYTSTGHELINTFEVNELIYQQEIINELHKIERYYVDSKLTYEKSTIYEKYNDFPFIEIYVYESDFIINNVHKIKYHFQSIYHTIIIKYDENENILSKNEDLQQQKIDTYYENGKQIYTTENIILDGNRYYIIKEFEDDYITDNIKLLIQLFYNSQLINELRYDIDDLLFYEKNRYEKNRYENEIVEEYYDNTSKIIRRISISINDVNTYPYTEICEYFYDEIKFGIQKKIIMHLSANSSDTKVYLNNGNRAYTTYNDDGELIELREIDDFNTITRRYQNEFQTSITTIIRTSASHYPYTELSEYDIDHMIDFVKLSIRRVRSETDFTLETYNSIGNLIVNTYDSEGKLFSHEEFQENISVRELTTYAYNGDEEREIESISKLIPYINANSYIETIIYEAKYLVPVLYENVNIKTIDIVNSIKKIVIDTKNLRNNIINEVHYDLSERILYIKEINGLRSYETFNTTTLDKFEIKIEPINDTYPKTEVITYYGGYINDYVKKREIVHESNTVEQTKLYNSDMNEIINIYEGEDLRISKEIILQTTLEKYFTIVSGNRVVEKIVTINPNDNANTYKSMTIYEDDFIENNVKRYNVDYIDVNANIYNIEHLNNELIKLYTNEVNSLIDFETYYTNGQKYYEIKTEPNTRIRPYTEVIQYYNTYVVDFVRWREKEYTDAGVNEVLFDIDRIEIENEYYNENDTLYIHRKIYNTYTVENYYTISRIIYMNRTTIPKNSSNYVQYDIYTDNYIEYSLKERRTFYENNEQKYIHHYNSENTRIYEAEFDGMRKTEHFLSESYTKITEPYTEEFEYSQKLIYHDTAIVNSIKRLEISYYTEFTRNERYYNDADFLMYEKDINDEMKKTQEIHYHTDGLIWFTQTIIPNTLVLPYVIEIEFTEAHVIDDVKKIIKTYNEDGTVDSLNLNRDYFAITNIYDPNDETVLIYTLIIKDSVREEFFYDSEVHTEYRKIVKTNNGILPYLETTIFTDGLVVDNVKKIETYYDISSTDVKYYNELDNVIKNEYDLENPALLIKQTEYDGLKTYIRTFATGGLKSIIIREPNNNTETYLDIILYEEIGIVNNILKIENEYINVSENIYNVRKYDITTTLIYEKHVFGITTKEYVYNTTTYELDYTLETTPNNSTTFMESKIYVDRLVEDNVKKIEMYYENNAKVSTLTYNALDNVIENIYEDALLVEQKEYRGLETFRRFFTENGLIKTVSIIPNDNTNEYKEITSYETIGVVDNIGKLEVEYIDKAANKLNIKRYLPTNELFYEKYINGFEDVETFYNLETHEKEYTLIVNPNTFNYPYTRTFTFFGNFIVDDVKTKVVKTYALNVEDIEYFNDVGNLIENEYVDDVLASQREIIEDQTIERFYTYDNLSRLLTHTTYTIPNTNPTTYITKIIYENAYVVDTIKMKEFNYINYTDEYTEKHYDSTELESIFYQKHVNQLVDEEYIYDRSGNVHKIMYVKMTNPNTRVFPYTEIITYTDGYIENRIKKRVNTFQSSVPQEVLYNIDNNKIELEFDNNKLNVFRVYYEELDKIEEEHYNIEEVMEYLRVVSPYSNISNYEETITYQVGFILEDIKVARYIFRERKLYKVLHYNPSNFNFYDKTITDTQETEIFYDDLVNYYIKTVESEEQTFIYYGNKVIDGVYKRRILTSPTALSIYLYDNIDQLYYEKTIYESTEIEKFYNDSVLEYSQETIPRTKIIPYDVRFVYYNHMIIDDIEKKIVKYVSNHETITERYIAGDIKVRSEEVNTLTSVSTDIVYQDSVEIYRTIITPINMESNYSSEKIFLESYSDERFDRNVKTIIIFYVDTLSNTDTTYYDDNGVLISKESVNNTITVKTIYDVNQLEISKTTISPNTLIYPYTKTIEYGENYIINNTKSAIYTYLTATLMTKNEISIDGNEIENVYDDVGELQFVNEYDVNKVLVKQTEYTASKLIERNYDTNGILKFTKTTEPKDKVYPYLEVIEYFGDSIENNVKEERLTYNSATDVSKVVLNTDNLLVENIYDSIDTTKLIEQKLYRNTEPPILTDYMIIESDLQTRWYKYNDDGSVYYEKLRRKDYPAVGDHYEEIWFSTYIQDEVNGNSYLTSKHEQHERANGSIYFGKKQEEGRTYYSMESSFNIDGQRQDKIYWYGYVLAWVTVQVEGGSCTVNGSGNYKRVNNDRYTFTSSMLIGSDSSSSTAYDKCNRDTNCRYLTRHKYGSSGIKYYRLRNFSSQDYYAPWGNKYAFAAAKLCPEQQYLNQWRFLGASTSDWYYE